MDLDVATTTNPPLVPSLSRSIPWVPGNAAWAPKTSSIKNYFSDIESDEHGHFVEEMREAMAHTAENIHRQKAKAKRAPSFQLGESASTPQILSNPPMIFGP